MSSNLFRLDQPTRAAWERTPLVLELLEPDSRTKIASPLSAIHACNQQTVFGADECPLEPPLSEKKGFSVSTDRGPLVCAPRVFRWSLKR